jgi:phenylacetaldehyde dehydrogenase
MHRLASKIKAGTVWGNCHAIIDPALPFGGFKQSGIGREYGIFGLDAFLEPRAVLS